MPKCRASMGIGTWVFLHDWPASDRARSKSDLTVPCCPPGWAPSNTRNGLQATWAILEPKLAPRPEASSKGAPRTACRPAMCTYRQSDEEEDTKQDGDRDMLNRPPSRWMLTGEGPCSGSVPGHGANMPALSHSGADRRKSACSTIEACAAGARKWRIARWVRESMSNV